MKILERVANLFSGRQDKEIRGVRRANRCLTERNQQVEGDLSNAITEIALLKELRAKDRTAHESTAEDLAVTDWQMAALRAVYDKHINAIETIAKNQTEEQAEILEDLVRALESNVSTARKALRGTREALRLQDSERAERENLLLRELKDANLAPSEDDAQSAVVDAYNYVRRLYPTIEEIEEQKEAERRFNLTEDLTAPRKG